MTASATGATSYQWRFNGVDLPGATNATLQITNTQNANTGYYLAIAQNATGWVPSQLAYLSLNYSSLPAGAGTLPFSNTNNTYIQWQITSQYTFAPPTNGSVQIMAGPELDQMAAVGTPITYGLNTPALAYLNGYFHKTDQGYAKCAPGQSVYYGILVNYTVSGVAHSQPSTILKINAGTNGVPAPPAYGLKFPSWPEWPEPALRTFPSTNNVLVQGETASFPVSWFAYSDFGIPTIQWRKDGFVILNATNFAYPGNYVQTVFTITNVQPGDCGVYDVEIFGNLWEVSPKIFLAVQSSVGQGVFTNPHLSGTNFVSNLLGAAGRNYDIQWSTNLVNWSELLTVSNATGTITFTNSASLDKVKFYRTVLLPP